jgi:mannose-6-phosphate isomerase-like protein (cupin superfamily)
MIRDRSNISSYVTKDGSTVWELFHPASSPVKDLSVAEALVEPGQETGAHRHQRSQEIYYVLEGSGMMRVGDESMSVKAGDAILMIPGAKHNIKNTGAGPLRILCICSPPYSHDDTALEK